MIWAIIYLNPKYRKISAVFRCPSIEVGSRGCQVDSDSLWANRACRLQTPLQRCNVFRFHDMGQLRHMSPGDWKRPLHQVLCLARLRLPLIWSRTGLQTLFAIPTCIHLVAQLDRRGQNIIISLFKILRSQTAFDKIWTKLSACHAYHYWGMGHVAAADKINADGPRVN